MPSAYSYRQWKLELTDYRANSSNATQVSYDSLHLVSNVYGDDCSKIRVTQICDELTKLWRFSISEQYATMKYVLKNQ